ncbi:hypothetical protein ACO1O0_007819 [Amphichorda felina]
MRSLQLQRHTARALRSTFQPSSTTRAIRPILPLASALKSSTPSAPFHTSPSRRKGREGNPSQHERTDFASLDVLGSAPVPSTSVDVCMYDGFGLNSGITIGDGDGALLVSGEAFSWRPWEAVGEKKLLNKKGQLELPRKAFGVLDVLWPRPDLLIIGVGKEIRPLSPETRMILADMGLRVEVLDTRNAASQFNMLATERGVSDVAAALIPLGWQEGVGAK